MTTSAARNVTVQRHVTIPMTKRDSLVLNGSRISLNSGVSNNSACWAEQDFAGTHPDTVAGKKRAKKPVKRTDSYKKATNRQSAVDDLSDVKDVPKRDSSSHTDGRKKYNTLPLRTDIIINKELGNGVSNKRKRGSDPHEILRNISQKSGTYPSPDTDEDQRAVHPERRKKSAFKRVKERLLLTFKKDKQNKINKRNKDKKNGSRSRVRPNKNDTKSGYATPDSLLNDSKPSSNGQHRHRPKDNKTTLGDKSEKDRERRELGIFQQFRNSFRTKERPHHLPVGQSDTRPRTEYPPYQNGSSSNSHPSGVGSPSQHSASPSQHSGSVSGHSGSESRHSGSGKTPSEPNNTTTSASSRSQPIEIPRTSHRSGPDTSACTAEEADDTISEIFGSIIDPSFPASPASSRTDRSPRSDAGSMSSRQGRSRRADRTALRLEGLRLSRPRSIDKTTPPCLPSQHRFEWQSSGNTRTVRADVHWDLSPTVEVDGVDEDQTDGGPGFVEEADGGFGAVSQEEQQRRVNEVARCLAAIGDRIAADRDSAASSGSDVEGHRVGSRRRQTSLERDIMMDLRAFGDDIDQRLFGDNGRQFSIGILPIVRNLIVAQDYSSFRRVIQRELTDTMGWDQVAWYTYLTKMAIYVCGRQVGVKVRNMAMRYFNTTIKPWVEAKPNGWESIHEETDVDTELD